MRNSRYFGIADRRVFVDEWFTLDFGSDLQLRAWREFVSCKEMQQGGNTEAHASTGWCVLIEIVKAH